MNTIIQLASNPTTSSIESILTTSSNNGITDGNTTNNNNILSNPLNSDLYFNALLKNQPPLSNRIGIVGLLLLPCAELEQSYNSSSISRISSTSISNDDRNSSSIIDIDVVDDDNNNSNDDNSSNNNNNNNKIEQNVVVSPEVCKLYLMAISYRIDSILALCHQRFESNHFNDLMKVGNNTKNNIMIMIIIILFLFLLFSISNRIF